MASRTLTAPKTDPLYDEDFLVWTEETARLLRAGRFDQLDVEHVAEEIEDMGKSQKHELESRLVVILVHLLKWVHPPEKRTGSWQVTIDTQRGRLLRLFRDSPSLRRKVPEALALDYPDAVRGASLQTRLPRGAFPARCPFTPEQILDPDFFPE